jgi:hypothetical protein
VEKDQPNGEEFTVRDISAFDHLLTTTRTVRKRLDLARPLEPEILERCLENRPAGANSFDIKP